MEDYKAQFINFLLETGALKVGGDFTLKSKRISPWFINIGDFNDAASSKALGRFYAEGHDHIPNTGNLTVDNADEVKELNQAEEGGMDGLGVLGGTLGFLAGLALTKPDKD